MNITETIKNNNIKKNMKIGKFLAPAVVAAMVAAGFGFDGNAKRPEVLWLGADISGTTADEARGQFSTDTLGNVTENTELMRQYDMNAVRLRVWVNPRGGWSSMKDVLVMAQRAKALGMEIMIDFHYSDWWADPEKQIIPEAWKDFDLEEMKAALAKHTAETLTLLKDNGINVKWVQVGNETRDGFLWPMGQLSKGNMANYAALTIAGYDAVKSVYPDAEVIVHLDNGFDNKTYNEIFDGLKQYGAQWDIIGMSVYPYWAIKYDHEPDAASTLRDAIDNIRKLNEKYGCKVMIVETGVDSSKPAEGLEFMNSLFDAVINDANGACTGVFYWAPEAFQMKGPDGQLHGYALGAFEDGHPTAILNSYPRAARLMR
jgi:arabinogalactan endo-1,4-beta-galactosidase